SVFECERFRTLGTKYFSVFLIKEKFFVPNVRNLSHSNTLPMDCTVEISMYPLDQQYESIVLDFLKRLHTHDHIQIETNGMSTQVFGDYNKVMEIIQAEMKAILLEGKAIFVMKVAQGTLRYNPEG
ncbi:MAG: hypothetical protein AAFR59_20455, partial [Bacteroidota bacterium]